MVSAKYFAEMRCFVAAICALNVATTLTLMILYLLSDIQPRHNCKSAAEGTSQMFSEKASTTTELATTKSMPTTTVTAEPGEDDPRFYDFFQRREQEYERRYGRKQLYEIADLREQNSDPLPLGTDLSANGANSTSSEWLNFTRICEEEDPQGCVPKLQFSRSMYYYVPDQSRRVMTCLISKNLSTILRAIICYLMFPEEFSRTGRPLAKEAFGARFCKHLNNHFWSTDVPRYAATQLNATVDEALLTWRPFAMLRDPIDRFLSAYVDKCLRDTRRPSNAGTTTICNGCQKNMTCFIASEYERMIRSHGYSADTFEDNHFMPQNWECNFREYFSHFQFLIYDSADRAATIQRVGAALAERNVSAAHVAYILENLGAMSTDHRTSGSPARAFLEYRLRSSPLLMQYIVRMYYWDYRLFGFQLPSIQAQIDDRQFHTTLSNPFPTQLR